VKDTGCDSKADRKKGLEKGDWTLSRAGRPGVAGKNRPGPRKMRRRENHGSGGWKDCEGKTDLLGEELSGVNGSVSNPSIEAEYAKQVDLGKRMSVRQVNCRQEPVY